MLSSESEVDRTQINLEATIERTYIPANEERSFVIIGFIKQTRTSVETTPE